MLSTKIEAKLRGLVTILGYQFQTFNRCLLDVLFILCFRHSSRGINWNVAFVLLSQLDRDGHLGSLLINLILKLVILLTEIRIIRIKLLMDLYNYFIHRATISSTPFLIFQILHLCEIGLYINYNVYLLISLTCSINFCLLLAIVSYYYLSLIIFI